VETGFDATIVRNDLIAEFYTVITKGVPVMPSSAANRVDTESTWLVDGS
jgi:hypothetical protein